MKLDKEVYDNYYKGYIDKVLDKDWKAALEEEGFVEGKNVKFDRQNAQGDQANCAIIARAEAFASKNTVTSSFIDGLFMGIGFTAVLVTLGAMRELIGFGTLFQQAHLMFGDVARDFTITLFDNYRGYLLAILPPGAFIGLGLLIAGKNIIDKKQAAREKQIAMSEAIQPST